MEDLPNSSNFREIIDKFIKGKTAVDDHRHAKSISGGEDVLVNLSISNSYADLHRQCVLLAEKWFILQFWPCRHTTSVMVYYSFKVRCMVQNRILRKDNPDAHYTNAIQ